jgi:hypothetical protein
MCPISNIFKLLLDSNAQVNTISSNGPIIDSIAIDDVWKF